MVKVFFGCSMRGGYDLVSKDELSKIQDIIEELGYKLTTRHQTQKGIMKREAKLTFKQIHDRDYKWIMESDIGIFEITNPSTGTGGEIADMTHLRKPILILFKKDKNFKVSSYIRGKQNSMYIKTSFEFYAYKNLEDVKRKIKQFVEKNSK